jgi:hypothetical protein
VTVYDMNSLPLTEQSQRINPSNNRRQIFQKYKNDTSLFHSTIMDAKSYKINIPRSLPFVPSLYLS